MSAQNQATAKNGLTVSKSGRAYGIEQTINGGGHEHDYSVCYIKIVQDGTISGSIPGHAAVKESYFSQSASGGGNHSHTFTPSVNDDISVTLGNGDTETRPKNFTTKIWKRTA